MRALVTGVAGFVGSHLAERLLRNGHQVTGLDSLTPYYDRAVKRRNLEDALEAGLDFHEVDVLTADQSLLLEGVDWVFHQAGQPGVRDSWTEFDAYVSNNILGTERMLVAALAAGVRRFVYASSSSVYGETQEYPTRESTLPAPKSPYGVTKLAAEHLCGVFGREFGLSTVSLRYFTVYGPRQRPDMAMQRLIKAGFEGSDFPMYGDGSQVRDFTYVDDVVDANLLAADRVLEAGTVLNVAGGSSVSLKEVIATVEKLLDRKIRVETRGIQAGDVARTGGDTTKAAEDLGWKPTTDILTGLTRQVEWYQARQT